MPNFKDLIEADISTAVVSLQVRQSSCSGLCVFTISKYGKKSRKQQFTLSLVLALISPILLFSALVTQDSQKSGGGTSLKGSN